MALLGTVPADLFKKIFIIYLYIGNARKHTRTTTETNLVPANRENLFNMDELEL